MRYLKMLSLILTIPLLMGSGTRETKLTEGTKAGNLAPRFEWQEDLLQSNHYVLVQFWAAYDPESRVNNLLMNRQINEMENPCLQMVSISFDESKSVFEETVKADQLIGFVTNEPAGTASSIFKKYALNEGFGNVLMDSKGVIIARNITCHDLKKIKF